MRKKKRKRSKGEKFKKQEKKKYINVNDETMHGVIVVLLFTLAIIFLLSFWAAGGVLGKYLLDGSEFLFGKCLWLVPIVLIAAAFAILKEIHKNVYLSTLLGIILFVLCFLAIIQTFFSPETRNAGWLGYVFSWPFLKLVGKWAGLVVFAAGLFISVLITFNIPLKKSPKEEEEGPEFPDEISEEIPESEKVSFESHGLGKILKKILPRPKFDIQPINPDEEKKEKKDELITSFSHPPISDYRFPPLELLDRDKGVPSGGDIRISAGIIQKTLENFGIEVEMGEVNIGPTVTQYTLRPSGGVKLSSITALHRDLSLALAAHPLRIEAPIPGRSLVGIEIPNKAVSLVRMRNLLEGIDLRKDPSRLNLVLGRDVAGNSVWADLAKMPHLLIAGATGSGKSICISSIILTLLYQKTPEELKFILMDPKRVELPIYNDIPHLLTPVIVDLNKIANALKWAIGEMERRYELLAEVKARNIFSYNSLILREKESEILPYIVIIIDELADIMAAFGREVEGAIIRLAQMSRAVGIHLIISTQRPSVEVITGLIKANITSRIAFQVASQVDSRTILDMSGADKLLGNGDMLFLSGETAHAKRIQGIYISDKEVKNVVKFIKGEKTAEYSEEIVTPSPETRTIFGGGVSGDDPLYEDAKELVVQAGKASASYLQRRLQIGYARAARLLDMLEEQGIIGPIDGAKPRKILIQTEKSENFEDNGEEDIDEISEDEEMP